MAILVAGKGTGVRVGLGRDMSDIRMEFAQVLVLGGDVRTIRGRGAASRGWRDGDALCWWALERILRRGHVIAFCTAGFCMSP